MTPKTYIFSTADYEVIVDPCYRRDLEDIARPAYLVAHKEHGVAGGVSQQLWAAISGAKHLQKALDDALAGKEPGSVVSLGDVLSQYQNGGTN